MAPRTTPYRSDRRCLLAASRQVWLAGLGAAVVTREWAQNGSRHVFRTLVKEGTAVESRTIRMVGDRLESSFTMANDLWRRRARHDDARCKQAADTAVDARAARRCRALPKVTLPAMLPRARAEEARRDARRTP